MQVARRRVAATRTLRSSIARPRPVHTYIYDAIGQPVGFANGKFVYTLFGNPVGHLVGSHVHKLTGGYVGELYKDMVVNQSITNGPVSSGSPGPAGASGSPGPRSPVSHGYPDVCRSWLPDSSRWCTWPTSGAK